MLSQLLTFVQDQSGYGLRKGPLPSAVSLPIVAKLAGTPLSRKIVTNTLPSDTWVDFRVGKTDSAFSRPKDLSNCELNVLTYKGSYSVIVFEVQDRLLRGWTLSKRYGRCYVEE